MEEVSHSFLKFLNNLTPDYTRNPISLFVPSSYFVRNPPVGKHVASRTESFKSSFYPDSLSEWNKLDPTKGDSSSVNVFKKKFFSISRPPAKSVYGIRDPKGVAYLTQLKVGLSKLNFHKFKHNFKDTINPMCRGNDGIEDTEHFLQLCNSFQEQSHTLLAGVNNFLAAYGYSESSNSNMLELRWPTSITAKVL